MREGRLVTNASLRQLGLDRHDDTSALSDLVGRGLAVSFDGRRYAKYVLAATTPRDTQLPVPGHRENAAESAPPARAATDGAPSGGSSTGAPRRPASAVAAGTAYPRSTPSSTPAALTALSGGSYGSSGSVSRQRADRANRRGLRDAIGDGVAATGTA